jgi:hypothetical protein
MTPVESFAISTAKFTAADRRSRIVLLRATTTRKSFLQSGLTAGASTVLAVNSPPTVRPAQADITSKLASTQALRNVKLAQKKLSSLAVVEFVSTADYANLKSVLRAAPLSDLRKACTVLIKAGEDGPEANNLQTTYQNLIAKLEKIDSVASVALRGRTVSEMVFLSSYEGAVTALGDFVAVAERSMDTPVQYIE